LITLVYGVSLNDITNNDIVLALACVLSDNLMLPHSYVTDAYGGYCGVPSTRIPAASSTTTNSSERARVL